MSQLQSDVASEIVRTSQLHSDVETVSRLARWKIDSLPRRSSSFRVGAWMWHMRAEESFRHSSRRSSLSRYLCIMLHLEHCLSLENQLPVARFVLCASKSGPGQIRQISPVNEYRFVVGGPFTWMFREECLEKYIVEVEFSDLKISAADGGETSYTLQPENWMKSRIQMSSVSRLSCMIQDDKHMDITIKLSNGLLSAHKAILVASSPVLEKMFIHDFRENVSAIIEIEDMSLESCRAMLNYFYGVIEQEEFWKHRHDLLLAAHKYDIEDLRKSCEESLLEDITIDNVLQRLNDSSRYELHILKAACLSFLFDFGKIYQIKDQLGSFICQAEKDLLAEMFERLLSLCKSLS